VVVDAMVVVVVDVMGVGVEGVMVMVVMVVVVDVMVVEAVMMVDVMVVVVDVMVVEEGETARSLLVFMSFKYSHIKLL